MRKYLILLFLLFASVLGITLFYWSDIRNMTELYMTEDIKPTASMLGDSVIESEVKKEVIPDSVIEEVLEPEVLEPEVLEPLNLKSLNLKSRNPYQKQLER